MNWLGFPSIKFLIVLQPERFGNLEFGSEEVFVFSSGILSAWIHD